jgi:hypothetical protein
VLEEVEEGAAVKSKPKRSRGPPPPREAPIADDVEVFEDSFFPEAPQPSVSKPEEVVVEEDEEEPGSPPTVETPADEDRTVQQTISFLPANPAAYPSSSSGSSSDDDSDDDDDSSSDLDVFAASLDERLSREASKTSTPTIGGVPAASAKNSKRAPVVPSRTMGKSDRKCDARVQFDDTETDCHP